MNAQVGFAALSGVTLLKTDKTLLVNFDDGLKITLSGENSSISNGQEEYALSAQKKFGLYIDNADDHVDIHRTYGDSRPTRVLSISKGKNEITSSVYDNETEHNTAKFQYIV